MTTIFFQNIAYQFLQNGDSNKTSELDLSGEAQALFLY